MKVTLVNPPQPYLITQRTQVPLGLLYLIAMIKQERPDIEASVLDASSMTVDETAEALKDTDVAGFTATSLDYPTVLSVARKLPDGIARIIGGPHATAIGAELLADGWTSVFIGESEYSIINFLYDLPTCGPHETYVQQYPVDMATLPYPDRDALGWVGGRVMVDQKDAGSINVMSSRGCPHNCRFCASAVMWKRRLRWRTPEAVAEEIRHCVEKYNTRTIRFSDDNITINHRWTRKFCELVKPLGIDWRVSIRVDTINPEILAIMKDAGCHEVSLGVESFDPSVLRILDKRIEPKHSLNAIKMCDDLGIGARILMMVSTPGECKNTPEINRDALESMRGKFVYLSTKILMPLPGTDIWNHPDKYRISIDSKDFSKYNFYIYQRNEAGEKIRSTWSPISFWDMDKEQQIKNIEDMFRYCETFREFATGDF